MTQLTKRYDRFTDTSLFHAYDRAPGVYLPEHVSVPSGSGKLRFDCDQSGGWGGWFGDKLLYPGTKISFGVQAFGGDALTGMVGFLWPTSDAWAEGEIDFVEGGFTASPLHAYHHSMTPGNEASAVEIDLGVSYAQRHLFAVDWQPTIVRYFVDGTQKGAITTNVPTTPHRFTFQSKPQPGSASAYALVDTVQFETTV